MTNTALNNIITNLDKELSKQNENIVAQKDNIHILAIDSLVDNQNNFYDTFDIEQLKLSIQNVGQLEPIIVSKKTDGDESYYLILSGHKRVKAHKELGLKEIKGIILSGLNPYMEELILIEANLQRIKTPSELAKEINMRIELYTKLGLKRTETLLKLADEYGVSIRTIQRKEKQAGLSEEQLKELDKGNLKVDDISKILSEDVIETTEISYEEILRKQVKSIIKKAVKENISKCDLIKMLEDEDF